MARRLLAVVIGLCLTGWALHAQERATFILTDGERISGVVVFHTNTRENLIDRDFSLGIPTVPRGEQIFHYDSVAVIDFIGGTPSQSELGALPASGNLLAMRNGETKLGKFINMIGGDTVKWQDDGGPVRSMPIRDVARIYLNPDSARNTFNYQRPAPQAATTNRSSGQGRGGANSRGNRNSNNTGRNTSVTVQGNAAWTETRLDVVRGDVLQFDASGEIVFIQGPNGTAGPAGRAGRMSPSYPVTSLPVGALIGRVGNNGGPFAIGANRNDITMPATGRLMLGVNDDGFGDNSGAFQVTIIKIR